MNLNKFEQAVYDYSKVSDSALRKMFQQLIIDDECLVEAAYTLLQTYRPALAEQVKDTVDLWRKVR